MMIRRLIRVQGIVQGVGFRPYVYNLATRHGLKGFVANSPTGVTVEVEGRESEVTEFLNDFRKDAPVLARIENVSVVDLRLAGDRDFSIRHSEEAGPRFALVPPEIGTCAECQADFTDALNRRYLYPFTNCTNCGPRYTIIQDVPYDRVSTTMSGFPMCGECRMEYENPQNRRFHAQPNACPVCGPHIELFDRGGLLAARDQAISRVRELLKQGAIVAIKGLGGFHLACDAENDAAVRQLRSRKRRSDKPFALMVPDLEMAERFCVISDLDRAELLSPRRPVCVLQRVPGSTISPAVAPGNNTVGVMLPYTPLHHLLFGDSPRSEPDFVALVMTSGNISEEPIVSRNCEVGERLGSLADYFLLHDRDIQTRVDDSVVRVLAGRGRVLRRSRGYAPGAIDVGMPVDQVLAVGGELKNTFCLTRDHYAILSQHIGDLENFETLTFFEETLDHLKRFLRVEPQVVAFDLHPQYLSTGFALGMEGVQKIAVQHHHAHIASCMAENHLREKVIGVAFDGTGYGTDGQIWGGEFLVCDYAGFERRAHLRYAPMPGGDVAVREPWRMALSYLRDTFGRVPDLPFLNAVPKRRRDLVSTMMDRGINTVLTSSCGRLFDAVAAVIGLRLETNFEGQAAIELESAAALANVHGRYEYAIDSATDPWQIDMRPMIAGVAEDIRAGIMPPAMAAKFHNTLSEVVADTCGRLRSGEGLDRVCLSGGSFQNRLLLEHCHRLLLARGFKVFLHSEVPPNDGGISLGQAVVACASRRSA